MPLHRVRITVLKKIDPENVFNGQVPTRPDNGEPYRICDAVEEEDVFVVGRDRGMPEGFCPSAWTSIGDTVSLIQWGGDYYPNLPRGTAITCCSDGIRPVCFRVERLEG
jgi:uncharacterized repeat protein (TIGR04076 family)